MDFTSKVRIFLCSMRRRTGELSHGAYPAGWSVYHRGATHRALLHFSPPRFPLARMMKRSPYLSRISTAQVYKPSLIHLVCHVIRICLTIYDNREPGWRTSMIKQKRGSRNRFLNTSCARRQKHFKRINKRQSFYLFNRSNNTGQKKK
jgi:hypothetical protein